MSHAAPERPGSGHAGFADTVLSLPPTSMAEAAQPLPGASAGPPSESAVARGPEEGCDPDLGAELAEPGADPAAEPDRLCEQPTLSHIGRYALKRQIGEGGIGRVYEAWDPLLSRAVAVKTLHFDLEAPSRKLGAFWSARVDLAHRALAVEDGKDFIWVWIGSHDEYERILR